MDDAINNVTPIYLATILNDTSWQNTTDDVIKPTNSAEIQLRLYDIFIPILGIVIILLNLAVVVSSGLILKKGQQPRSTYLFLGNVALTDLLTGIAVLFGQFFPRAHRGELSCAMQIGMIVSATITSVYSLGLIAVDRYLYIVYGLQYQRYIYPTRARIMIIITWIIGIVIGFLPAMGWRGDTKNGKICWFIIIAPPELVILTTSIGVLPLLLIIILYSIILYYALRKVVQLKQAAKRQDGFVAEGNLRIFTGGRSYTVNQANTNISNNAPIEESEKPLNRRRWTRFFTRNKKSNENVRLNTGKSPSKWKAIKVVLFTTGSFVVTWVPYFIACVWYVSCNPETTPDLCNRLRIAIAAPLAILGFANSLINPIIYAWWHNGFRESVRRIYFKTKRKPRTDATASTSVGSSSGGGGGDGGGGGRGSSAGGIATTGINEQSDTETLDNSESEINPNIKQRRLTINDAVIVNDTSPNDAEIIDGTANTNGTKNNTSLTNEQQNN